MSPRFTNHRAAIITSLVMMAALVSACDKKTPSSGTVESSETIAPPPVIEERVILKESFGKLRVGLTRAEVEAIDDLFALEPDAILPDAREGTEVLYLASEEGGFGDVFIELVDGKVATIRLESPSSLTAEKVGPSSRAKALVKAYGTPDHTFAMESVERGAQPGLGLCARYDNAPGRLFCFAPMMWQDALKSWEDVEKADEAISNVYLVSPDKLPTKPGAKPPEAPPAADAQK